MIEPRWVERGLVLAIHADQLRQHGGRPGVRDEGGLDSALHRPKQRFNYQADTTLAELGAAYAYAIAKTHPFIDGNKRTAFQAMYTFMGLNGLRIVAGEPEVVQLMVGVASSEMDEQTLAQWIREHSEERSPPIA